MGFCELRWLHLGVKYGYFMATLVPSWGQLRRFWGCVGGYMGSFWTMLLRHQKQPKDTPPKRSFLALKAKQNQIKNRPKTQNSAKTLAYMTVKAKRNQKSSQNPPSKRPPQSSGSLNLLRDCQNKGHPEQSYMRGRCFCESYQLEGKSPTSTPCKERAVWADLAFFLAYLRTCCIGSRSGGAHSTCRLDIRSRSGSAHWDLELAVEAAEKEGERAAKVQHKKI